MTDKAKVGLLWLAAWSALLLLPNAAYLSCWPWVLAPAPMLGPPSVAPALVNVEYVVSGLAATLLAVLMLARGRAFIVITAPFMALMPLELLYITTYGEPSSPHVVGVIAETSAGEALEFLSGATLPMLAGVILLWGLALVVARKAWRANWSYRHRLHRPLVMIFVGTLVAVVVPTLAFEKPEPVGARLLEVSAMPLALADTSPVYPLGVPIRIADYVGQRSRIAEAMTRPTAPFHSSIDPARGPFDVILVLGESARADHFGINGYARDTTPELRRLDGLVTFPDAVSLAAATRVALPFILTQIPAGSDLLRTPPVRSIVGAFGEAGFDTSWISNQMAVGPFDSAVAVYAEEAGRKKFLNLSGFRERSTYDGALADELERVLTNRRGPTMTVLHMLGSHWDYRRRYPQEFRVYEPVPPDTERLSAFDRGKRDLVVNAYDNSIRYTDHVLTRIVHAAESAGRPTVVLFVSDHGQQLFSGDCTSSNHGIESRTVFNVPLMVWMSPQARAARPDAWAALQENATRPVTTRSVFPTLIDLAGIAMPNDGRELSLASPTLARERRRVSSDTVSWMDYDTDLPRQDCALRNPGH